jgi:hypothetical protein
MTLITVGLAAAILFADFAFVGCVLEWRLR